MFVPVVIAFWMYLNSLPAFETVWMQLVGWWVVGGAGITKPAASLKPAFWMKVKSVAK